MKQKILIITATDKEMRALELTPNLLTHVCGIGLSWSATEIMWSLYHYRPSIVIMVGIAGKYPHSQLQIGESVLVESEYVADMGAYHGTEFRAMNNRTLLCEYTNKYNFRLASSASVNLCASPFLGEPSAEIENMEGASFFASAIRCKVPFLELRTISNTVSPNRDDWDLELAFKNMNLALKKLLHELED